MAQLVKKTHAMRETWVQSLGWEDPLERGKATHSSILAWSISWTVSQWGRKELERLSNFHLLTQYLILQMRKPKNREFSSPAQYHTINTVMVLYISNLVRFAIYPLNQQ